MTLDLDSFHPSPLSTSSGGLRDLIWNGSRFAGAERQPLRAHSRGVSPENIQRRVVIRVRSEAAMPTPVHRLALAGFGVNDSTVRTSLGCIGSGHLHQPAAAFFEFVGKDRLERIPALVQDRAIEPALMLAAGRHVGNLKVLQRHRSKAAYNVQCRLVVPILADAGYPCGQSRHTAQGFDTAYRTNLLARQRLLSPSLSDIHYCHVGKRKHLASREGQRVSYSPIYTNGREGRYLNFMLNLAAEGYMPAECVTGNCGIFYYPATGPGISELHPADIRKARFRPFTIELANRNVSSVELEALAGAALSRRRVFAKTLKKILERTIKIKKSEFLTRPIDRSDPIVLRPKYCKFTALRREADIMPHLARVLPPKRVPLLPRHIVDQSAHAAELAKGFSLRRHWIKLVAEGAKHREARIA